MLAQAAAHLDPTDRPARNLHIVVPSIGRTTCGQVVPEALRRERAWPG